MHDAFSLIELGIVLLIIGILAGAVLKGHDLLQTAKANSVINDIHQYKNAILLYQSTFGEWPGDDGQAHTHFPNVMNGDGDGLVQGEDCPRAWTHLNAAGHVSLTTPPSSKMGGHYHIISNPMDGYTGLYLALGDGEMGLSSMLTPKQAHIISSKAQDGGPNEGIIQFASGDDHPQNACIVNGSFDLSHDHAACIMLVKIH